MARKRRSMEIFSMSFLDCMSCGFGAVILFFMIINHATKDHSDRVNRDLISETNLLEKRVELGKRNLAETRNQADALVHATEKSLGELGEKVEASERASIESAISDVKEAHKDSGEQGMQTFDDALLDLYKAGTITLEEAMSHADSRSNLEAKINFGG